MSSKNNDSYTSNIDIKSSKIIKVSKDRVESAKNRVNYITLKYGDFDLTSQIKNDLNKRNINKVVSNLEKRILINSKSYGRIDRAPNENLRNYLKEINVKSSNKKNRSIIKSNAKKKKNFNIDSSRNLKTSENENKNNIYNNINIDDVYNKYNIKIVPEKKEEIDEDNNNNEEKTINLKKGIEENNSRNIGNNEEEKFMENLKSEEEKKYIISSSSNNIIKNNNFFNKQFSDKPVNCISEEEDDSKKNILISKLELEPVNTKLIKNEKENNQKIISSENDELIKGLENKNNIIIDNESSKTSKLIDEKSENDINKKEETNNHEIIKINNKFNEKNVINPNDNNIKFNEMKIKEKEKEEGKQSIVKINDELKGKNKPPDDFKNIKTYQNIRNIRRNLYRKCSICENNYPLSKLFVPLCEIHYLCRHCSKYYIEDLIENGIKEIACPFIKCKKPFDKNDLKDIISSHHFNLLKNDNNNLIEESNNFYYNQKKENDDERNSNHYSKKNVIDINTNKKLYNYKSTKGVVCSNCNMESLFSKTNAHFLKCLYCNCKKCKYCLKDYDDEHMEINSPNHCKVYYRYERKDLNNNGFCFKFLLQLFFVIACYFLCFGSTFIKIRSVFYFVFRAKKTRNIILYIFAYFFTICFFIIIIPFYIIFYPFFPCIISSTDY